jgi:nucleoside-diphosphate-sugar epimerase
MESVLITGANGFIGSNLCAHFTRRSFRVYAMVRPTSDLHFLDGLDVELVHGDLADPASIRIPPGVSFIVHAASTVSDFAGEKEARRNTVETTKNLVGAVRARGISLKRFIYISSTLVLGCGRLGISEAAPGRSMRFLAYTRAKQEAEAFLREQHGAWGLPLVILRPADVFGPHDRTASLKLLSAMESGVPPIVGRGDRQLGFCYVGNIALACELVCGMKGVNGKAYTVANGQEVTWKRLFGGFLERLGRRQRIYVPVIPLLTAALFLELLHAVFPRFQPPLSRYRVLRATTDSSYDIGDTVKDLGYTPDQDLERQMDEIVGWYLEEKGRKGRK